MSTYQDRARGLFTKVAKAGLSGSQMEIDYAIDQALSELASIIEEELRGLDEQLSGIAADVQGYDGWSEEFVKGYLAAVKDNHLNIQDILKQRDQIGTIKQLSNRSKSDE